MAAQIRLLTTTGQSTVRSIDSTHSVLDVKRALLADWPAQFRPMVSLPDEIKMIFAGRVLYDTDVFHDLQSVSPAECLTVHILLRALPTETILDEESYFHFHGCSISVEEIAQMQFVFRRKSDPRDNRLAFDRVHSFLRTYW